MLVLLAVSAHPLPSPRDLRMPDESCLVAHLSLLLGVYALGGVGCTQTNLERCAHCVADVLLQRVPRLVEVRAAAQGYPSAAELACMGKVVYCCPSGLLAHALQHTHLCSALQSLNLSCGTAPASLVYVLLSGGSTLSLALLLAKM